MMGKKGRNSSSLFMIILGVGMIGIALYLLVPALLDYKKTNDSYERLEEEYVTVEPKAEVDEDAWWYEDVDVQLSALQQVNPDIIGWIRFDQIDVLSYPILYSGDDETYLRTDLYGNDATAGCIFMEGICTPDFNDSHTILYGHNMKNLSMFGSLKKYKTEGFYEENQFFTIYTDTMAYRYQIFAYRDVAETDQVYSTGYQADDEFQSLIEEMQRRSYEDTGVEVSKEDKIMTLSTCSTEGNRFVVHAVRVGEHPYGQTH